VGKDKDFEAQNLQDRFTSAAGSVYRLTINFDSNNGTAMKDKSEFQAFLVTTTTGMNPQVTPLPTTPLFALGHVVSTPAALKAMYAADVEPVSLLGRHVTGDWGNLDKHDKQLNDLAVKDDSRILSAYDIAEGQRIWLITEADRSSTCFLFPSEY
jgi:hypothetical protein